MTDQDDMVATDVPLDDFSSKPTCRTCLAQLNPVRAILDTATGRNVRMYECDDCGQRFWQD
jgi:uncharacterized protein with PIN domain